MAYTNAWDESQPQGTAAASTIDDIIRQLKTDIRERMNSIVNSWAADPIVPQWATGKTMCLGWEAVMPDFDGYSTTVDMFDGYTMLNGAGYIVVPCDSGWDIRTIEVAVDKNAAAALYMSVQKRQFATSQLGAGEYGPVTYTGTGTQIVSLYSTPTGTAGIMIGSTDAITIRISDQNPSGPSTARALWRFIGARITYNLV